MIRTRVSICIATYKRPECLARLLLGLGQLRFERSPAPDMEVIVADNEAQGRAARVCHEIQPRVPWPIRAFDESQRGITFARNRALSSIRPDADFVAFIDDDEVPDPAWIDALLEGRRRYGADVVTGPVVPIFECPPPAWAVPGRFYGPRKHPDGKSLTVAFTNNVLFRAAIPRELGRAFDHQFALTGGEDTDFFMRVHRAGNRIVWVANAVVRETVPASRVNVSWLLRRGYREWGSHARCERAVCPSLAIRAERMVKACALVTGGIGSLPFAALLGRHQLVRALLTVSRGVGSVAGLLGHHYAEYETPFTEVSSSGGPREPT
jgi:glycosyltransferase involved in cell wall biosynthesis